MGRWTWAALAAVAGLLCVVLAAVSGLAAVLIGSDEALAARPFMGAAMGLLAFAVALFGAAGGAAVRAFRSRRGG